jgi:ribosomal-protein-alanine N-acetyltransferase
MNTGALECRRLASEWKEPLLAFLKTLEAANDVEYFHPHPFTHDALEKITQTVRRDLYYILAEGEDVLGYGMLRGWDEGYEIPSLGIAIHPGARNAGLGKFFMQFLSAAAKRRGATRVRLRVKSGNTRAVKLYEDLGYDLRPEKDGYLVGFLDLNGSSLGN